ncbi:hypothetical protein DL96DRAFT_1248939 [Flagelloscypha sp. PMI_526]|nr:hypothetical protein DL96DRAFT_1248939 [Flagelloscypha sp. PMI_526]
MIGTLPADLYPDILSFLSGSRPKDTLKLCSLVSPDFRSLSHALLFKSYTIDLRIVRDGVSPSVEALNRGLGPPVSNYIKVLTLWTEDILGHRAHLIPMAIVTRFLKLKNLPSLLRLRLVVKCETTSERLPALSDTLFKSLLPLVRGRAFDLEWKGRSKFDEAERLNILLGAAQQIDYLHIVDTPVSDLITSTGPHILPSHLHLSSNSEDNGIMPSRLDLSRCTSLSLESTWPLQMKTIFLSLVSSTLRNFHYAVAVQFPPYDQWLPLSVFQSLEALENFSLNFKSTTVSIQQDGLPWALNIMRHIQDMPTLKSICLDMGFLQAARVESQWHVHPDIFQGLSNIGEILQRMPHCKITIGVDVGMIEQEAEVDKQRLKMVELDLRKCLSGSKDKSEIQVNIRSFLTWGSSIPARWRPAFHYKLSCNSRHWILDRGSWVPTVDCACWVPP